MYLSPILPTDVNGNINPELLVLSEKVCVESAKLTATHNKHIIASIKELLRKTNSYYSNKIESEGTHPINIEKAMKKIFSEDSKERELQNLSIAYIDTQRKIEKPDGKVYSKEFIKSIHKEFYGSIGFESILEIHYENTIIKMKAGEFRKQDVEINNYIAPNYSLLDMIFNEFETLYKYNKETTTKAKRLLYAISAHHRLLYAHPFLDGNGRVSRLFLDALMVDMDLDGYGLWNISRGLARDTKKYSEHLKMADTIKQGATDGRGVLSSRGLAQFTQYMLNIALDQIEFMKKNLVMDTFGGRIDKFIQLSKAGLMGDDKLPELAAPLFKELLIHGELTRGSVAKIIGKGDRTATKLISELLKRDYLESDSPKGKIRLKFNAFFASKIIPNLMPDVN